MFLDVFTITGGTACTSLLCLSMFLIVVLHKDLERHRGYFWAFLSYAITYPFGISILISPSLPSLFILFFLFSFFYSLFFLYFYLLSFIYFLHRSFSRIRIRNKMEIRRNL